MSMSDSTGDFAGTQTPGTNIYMAGGTIDDCLHALDIGFPRAVGAPVGVGDLDPKGNTLVTELTLCHPLHLLAVQNQSGTKAPLDMIAEFDTKCKHKFHFFQNFFSPLSIRSIYTIINPYI